MSSPAHQIPACPTCRWISAAILILSLLPGPAHAGSVQTLDGKTYEGLVAFSSRSGLAVTLRTGNVVNLNLGDVLAAQFRAGANSAPAVPQRWQGRDVGQPALPGSSGFSGPTLTIRASGADMTGNKDQFYFVYQTLVGDGQVVARITSLQKTDKFAKAGVMVRATLDHASPHAMMLRHADGDLCLQYRTRLGAQSRQRGTQDSPVPVWVKLVRSGNSLSGYSSLDGEDWELLATETVTLPPQVLVGVALCARNPGAICTATFDRVTVTRGAAQGGASSPQSFKGAVLRNGSMVAGQVQSANGSAVRLFRTHEQTVSIPSSEVARLVFRPLSPQFQAKLNSARGGVLLSNGDFFEGDISEIGDGRIKVGSVLFGMRRFELSQVMAVVLRETAAVASNYLIRTADGSVLYADQMRVERDTLAVDMRSAGTLKFTAGDVLEIRAGSSRFQSLADLKPVKVEGIRGQPAADLIAVDGALAGLPMVLDGKPCQRGVALAAGASVSYRLDGAYHMLLLQMGVPDGILPVMPVRFTVIADQKEIYRTPALTSIDDAEAVSLNVRQVKTLLIRLEPGGAGQVGGCGLMGDPALIK